LSLSTPPKYEARPTVKSERVEGLGVVLRDIKCGSLPGICYNRQIYKKNMAESEVKPKQRVCGKSAAVAVTK